MQDDQSSRTIERVGILGGGQLALMLADAASRMNLKPLIFTGSAEDPAARVYPEAILGDLKNTQALENFLSKVQAVVFENEFIDVQRLQQVAMNFPVQFFPPLASMHRVQNKWEQKKLFKTLKIPAAMDDAVDLAQPWSHESHRLLEALGERFVLKLAQMGYDGKGVLRVDRSFEKQIEAEQFCTKAKQLQVQVYAEKEIDFVRELAMIAVASREGKVVSYPLVISEQVNGICNRVYGPAIACGVGRALEIQAQQVAQKIVKEMGWLGTFGLEFFETADGSLLLNEMAPRVHNSGHYTQDACKIDQFENHWRALLEMPMEPLLCDAGFAMVNLLGPWNLKHPKWAEKMDLVELGPGIHFHWYGKKRIMIGRKVGHLNGNVSRVSEIENLLNELEKAQVKWQASLCQLEDL